MNTAFAPYGIVTRSCRDRRFSQCYYPCKLIYSNSVQTQAVSSLAFASVWYSVNEAKDSQLPSNTKGKSGVDHVRDLVLTGLSLVIPGISGTWQEGEQERMM